MSIAEIKQAIRHLSAEEWMEVQACLWERAGVPTIHTAAADQAATADGKKFVNWEDVRGDLLLREDSPSD